jgi:hypothetical protein
MAPRVKTMSVFADNVLLRQKLRVSGSDIERELCPSSVRLRAMSDSKKDRQTSHCNVRVLRGWRADAHRCAGLWSAS